MSAQAPRFWGARAGFLSYSLAPLAAIYGAVASARLRRNAPRAELPTIVVGGLTLGGDGKTPLVLALAEMLQEMGERAAILSRGFGRADRGLVIVDAARHSAREVGDEALLSAQKALTIVGADRAAAARLAKAQGATALLLDDGLHSRSLKPDLALLVVDADYGAGSGFCPPAGPLRAPIAAQLAAADALVVIGTGEAWGALPAFAPKLHAQLAPTPGSAATLAGAKLFAFAGIGRPEKFRRTLSDAGAQLCDFRAFPDHHVYSRADLAALERAAQAQGARLITTRKDAVRIGSAVESLSVDFIFKEEARVKALLREALKRR
ncbi:MAG TPA: tetraacyldisaccharide 4'-kinase [Methylocystis sp.]|nr:tetraacyldisaccharide 4'-kinase [Methylocystis sp.]